MKFFTLLIGLMLFTITSVFAEKATAADFPNTTNAVEQMDVDYPLFDISDYTIQTIADQGGGEISIHPQ